MQSIEVRARRAALVAEARALVERDPAEENAEDRAQFDRLMAEVDRLGVLAERLEQFESEERASALAATSGRADQRDADGQSAASVIRRALLARESFTLLPDRIEAESGGARAVTPLGEHRSRMSDREIRAAITKASTGAPVPTSFYDQLVWHQVQVSPLRQLSTVIQTASGENMQIPRTSANSSFALIAEAGTFTNTEPTLAAFITLGTYKLGGLIQISTEMAEDEGVDLLAWLAEQAGVALGVGQATYLTTGTGSSQPTGIVQNATVGVTGGTGVAGAFTADNIIDLLYSVNAAYRALPGCAWLMRDTTIAAVRKLKDSQNRYLWEPGLNGPTSDTLLGFPIYSCPDVAAVALNAKSVVFGSIPRFYVREARGIRFERSDEFAFGTGLISYRAYLRFDSNLVDQTGAVKVFVGAGT